MENKAQNNIINTLYAFLVISTILGFMPNMYAFTASLALWIITLIAAYIYRGKDSEDGLLYNHMTYLIGTIWIATSFILLGTLVAGLVVFWYGDNSPLNAVVAGANNGQILDEAALRNVMAQYFSLNKNLILTASTVIVGPTILYFIYRVANGLSRAAKGYRLANPKSWL